MLNSSMENKQNTESVQFQENIDFAAYLNLDQYETGSLMGGQSTELNSSRNRLVSFV